MFLCSWSGSIVSVTKLFHKKVELSLHYTSYRSLFAVLDSLLLSHCLFARKNLRVRRSHLQLRPAAAYVVMRAINPFFVIITVFLGQLFNSICIELFTKSTRSEITIKLECLQWRSWNISGPVQSILCVRPLHDISQNVFLC